MGFCVLGLLTLAATSSNAILIAVPPVDAMVGLTKVLRALLVLSLVGFAGRLCQAGRHGHAAYVNSIATPERG